MSSRKKKQHYIPGKYINSWRDNGRLFALNLEDLRPFSPTGKNTIGAEEGFYSFDFDETVINLLKYTFAERACQGEPGNVYVSMLAYIERMKTEEFLHKEFNLLENFYEKIEGRINEALDLVLKGQFKKNDSENFVFENLTAFFCLQLMRTKKARDVFSEWLCEIHADQEKLNEKQKADYLKMNLLIQSLAMLAKIFELGAVIRLSYVNSGEKFILSDVPVILTKHPIRDHRDISGFIPLGPDLLMTLDNIGAGKNRILIGGLDNSAARLINMFMIEHANRMVCFSSEYQRQNYVSRLRLSRMGCKFF